MLDFEGTPCDKRENWNLDECILNQLEKESMSNVGCVSPYGSTKEHICKNPDQGK